MDLDDYPEDYAFLDEFKATLEVLKDNSEELWFKTDAKQQNYIQPKEALQIINEYTQNDETTCSKANDQIVITRDKCTNTSVILDES